MLRALLYAGGHDATHFLVDVNRGVFRVVAVLRDFAAQEDRLFLLAEGQRAERAHAPVANHLAGDFRGAFDVVARAGGDVAEENFLGAAAAHQHGERAFEISLRVGVLIVDGQLHGQAERHAARNDRDLVQRIGARSHGRDQGVARFVIRGVALLFLGQESWTCARRPSGPCPWTSRNPPS